MFNRNVHSCGIRGQSLNIAVMITDIQLLRDLDGCTFDEGVAVLTMCNASPGVVQHIVRTHNKGYLHSEMNRMLRMPGVMQLLKSKMPPSVGAAGNAPSEAGQHQEQARQPSETPSESEDPRNPSDENGEAVTVADVRSHRYTRYEDMPTELAQSLWLKKQDKYRLMQQMHLKMRLVPEGEEHNGERAQYRAAVLSLDDEIKDLWELIDAEIERFETRKDGAEKELNPKPSPSFKESTYRAYISRKLAKPSLTDGDIVEVQHRVDEMLACGLVFSDELTAKMQAAGIRIG